MKQYAIINYKIVEVSNVRIGEKTVKYSDCYCSNCETSVSNFVLGSKEELNIMLKNEHQEKLRQAIKSLGKQKLNNTEKMILNFLIDDEPDTVDEAIENSKLLDTIKRITIKTLKYTECNDPLFDAYMDYMH